MGRQIYQCDESMGNFHWETRAFVSEEKKEVSITQTWFDDTKVISKQNVMMMTDELRDIISRIDKV